MKLNSTTLTTDNFQYHHNLVKHVTHWKHANILIFTRACMRLIFLIALTHALIFF